MKTSDFRLYVDRYAQNKCTVEEALKNALVLSVLEYYQEGKHE